MVIIFYNKLCVTSWKVVYTCLDQVNYALLLFNVKTTETSHKQLCVKVGIVTRTVGRTTAKKDVIMTVKLRTPMCLTPNITLLPPFSPFSGKIDSQTPLSIAITILWVYVYTNPVRAHSPFYHPSKKLFGPFFSVFNDRAKGPDILPQGTCHLS